MSAKPEVGVGAVVIRDGRLLLIRRGHDPGRGTWSLPGGRLRRGETLHQGVLRELVEETGLQGRVVGPPLLAERIDGLFHYVILDFEVEVDDDIEPVAGDDADEARFVTAAEMRGLVLVDGLTAFLAEHDLVGRIS